MSEDQSANMTDILQPVSGMAGKSEVSCGSHSVMRVPRLHDRSSKKNESGSPSAILRRRKRATPAGVAGVTCWQGL